MMTLVSLALAAITSIICICDENRSVAVLGGAIGAALIGLICGDGIASNTLERQLCAKELERGKLVWCERVDNTYRINFEKGEKK